MQVSMCLGFLVTYSSGALVININQIHTEETNKAMIIKNLSVLKFIAKTKKFQLFLLMR